jgi:molybdopterin-containing oxidoreductase family membrane subunit
MGESAGLTGNREKRKISVNIHEGITPEGKKYGEQFTLSEISEEIYRASTKPSLAYFIALGICVALVLAGVATVGYLVIVGMGAAGFTPPVFWVHFIINFVFWVGIAHSGTLISAVLHLFRSKWRRGIFRIAEAMTVFAVMTAGLFPLIHIGRQWYFYYLVPYPNQRQLWVNFKSALMWDFVAVLTYFTVSLMFFYVGMIPDLATFREKAKGIRRFIYSLLSLGWKGTDKEWRHYNRSYMFFAAFATPLVISVHSVVSLDFASGLLPGWQSTIFPPYFVAGAIFSGMAMVVTIVTPLRKLLKLEKFITDWHYDHMGKMILVTGLIVTYSYIVEFVLAIFSGSEYEYHQFIYRATGDYAWAFWLMVFCNCFVPLLMISKKVRTNVWLMFVLSIFVNIGMWFERFNIIMMSLSHDFVPYAFDTYKPRWAELLITAASFGWFFMWFLLFAKFLPVISIAETKELVPKPKREKES